MLYETVYDIGAAGYDGWLLVFIGAGAVFLGFHFLYLSRTQGGATRDFALLWLIIAFLWTGWAVGSSWQSYRKLKAFLAAGAARTVEGRVALFAPKMPGLKPKECFMVKDQRFCYSEFRWAGGFKRDSAHGGPVADGLAVRIHYAPPGAGGLDGNRILRLEVARPTSP